jgi:cbb3-type cytochrome oxidase maturation protein
MSSVYLLVPLSIVLLGVSVWAFFWAVNHGQFEDLEAGERAALDDDAAPVASLAPSPGPAPDASGGADAPRSAPPLREP